MKNAQEARQISIDSSMDIINIYLKSIEVAASEGETHINITNDPIFGGVLAYFQDNGFIVKHPEGGSKYGSIEW